MSPLGFTDTKHKRKHRKHRKTSQITMNKYEKISQNYKKKKKTKAQNTVQLAKDTKVNKKETLLVVTEKEL